MAKPNAKGPSKTIDIFCKQCNSQLLKYRKGGKGALVKCFIERIVRDYTIEFGTCPTCQLVFARKAIIRGVPALKIVGGKVHYK